jgi:signal transduction histidine kinase
MLKLAFDHNENQLDIINSLLKIAQVEANKIIAVRKKTDLIKLLSGVIESQKPLYDKKNMRLRLKTDKSTYFCSVDPLQIQMVFENLVHNAYKYSPEGREVIVEIATSNSEIIIQVKDEGVGIDSKDIPKLFKKFSRVENINSTASGTGLGLYWAKQLIDLHKGEISVDSVLGNGTTITVRLPREEQV